jgi:hypothetical protein
MRSLRSSSCILKNWTNDQTLPKLLPFLLLGFVLVDDGRHFPDRSLLFAFDLERKVTDLGFEFDDLILESAVLQPESVDSEVLLVASGLELGDSGLELLDALVFFGDLNDQNRKLLVNWLAYSPRIRSVVPSRFRIYGSRSF